MINLRISRVLLRVLADAGVDGKFGLIINSRALAGNFDENMAIYVQFFRIGVSELNVYLIGS